MSHFVMEDTLGLAAAVVAANLCPQGERKKSLESLPTSSDEEEDETGVFKIPGSMKKPWVPPCEQTPEQIEFVEKWIEARPEITAYIQAPRERYLVCQLRYHYGLMHQRYFRVTKLPLADEIRRPDSIVFRPEATDEEIKLEFDKYLVREWNYFW